MSSKFSSLMQAKQEPSPISEEPKVEAEQLVQPTPPETSASKEPSRAGANPHINTAQTAECLDFQHFRLPAIHSHQTVSRLALQTARHSDLQTVSNAHRPRSRRSNALTFTRLDVYSLQTSRHSDNA